ncbi:MAG: 4-(cytidine 5'-diphospho)-2-C-methyl-D-erythritol kinase [Eubacteriales bacterium]|nr:4-(cytidine 5'-diphospho)-2-C-methyl-D-erythritol kinase [Eubacteriales bacterium]MDD4583117.1 4-(cytidine 5'-diphospho)-2-C-methyl-D-erythritol kinase [Eubacteriales bacterium]
MEITLKAYGKINLSIDVLGKRPDGYHEVCMVMQMIDLWDRIKVRIIHGSNPQSIQITTDCRDLPPDKRNLAYRAAELMLSRYGGVEKGGIGIHLEKKIPMAAGLAGGSGDGAAVLHALNKLWDLRLPLSELMDLGVKLGADVPFCLMGQGALEPVSRFTKGHASTCALATGIGEKLVPLSPIDAWVVLSKPPISVSTKEVYEALNLETITKRPNTGDLVQGLKEADFDKISKNMYNVLENVSEIRYPPIVYTKNIIQSDKGRHQTMMSGSGPTVFAITPDFSVAERIYNKIKKVNDETFLVETL